MFRFASPHWLWLLVGGLLYWALRQQGGAVPIAGVSRYSGLVKWRIWWAKSLPLARVMAFSLLVVALARPQQAGQPEPIKAEAIDIMFALDTSTSMAAEDFEPSNRLDVAKRTIAEFIARRRSDRIGLITFAGHTWLKCPLTFDYRVLRMLLDSVQLAAPEDDGTAIGLALASATNHLRDAPARSRVIILLTDGENNRFQIEPATGAQLAAAMGIRVYAIGVGRPATQVASMADPVPGRSDINEQVTINEESLRQIAEITDGRFFRATDSQALARVLGEVDQLERTPLEGRIYVPYRELYQLPILVALALLLVEMVLAHTWLRRLG